MTVQRDSGALFGGYRIEQLIGRGGMGVVYKATDLRDGRPVALKLLRPDLAHDPRFRERFRRESTIASALDHPNVIPVYGSGEQEGALFIAMQYVEGTDLGAVIATEAPLGPARAASIVAQVASALEAAHERGLVHRDVKPGNVMLEPRSGAEHAYLTDFGLIKGDESGLTKTGHWVGTVQYAAPEQLRAEPLDRRTDVYALGCVLYEALTGRVPYPRAREVATITAHLTEPPPAVTAAVPSATAAFDDVVARAMAKLPGDRFHGAGQLGRAALEAAAAAGPAPVAERTRKSAPKPAIDRSAPTKA